MIEVQKSHLLRLNHCIYALTKNAKVAEKYLQAYCDNNKRDRGYTLRFIPDHATQILDLQDDKQLNVRMALRALSDAGLLVKTLPWKEVEIHKTTRNKLHTGV